jgi:hypothetical protein
MNSTGWGRGFTRGAKMLEPALLFAGPSAWGLPPSLEDEAGVRLLPPVRRGDVKRHAAAARTPGVMIICDGVFQAYPAVSHRELCDAIDAGWRVWGVSSLGAIRAHELRHEGMRGFGEVYAMFGRFDDFTDDEMCLLHFPEAPYFPVTEALVNLRHALDQRGPGLGISEAQASTVIDTLRALWFGDRTPERMRSALLEQGRMQTQAADQLLLWLTENRLKTLDLERLLRARPWHGADARAQTP